MFIVIWGIILLFKPFLKFASLSALGWILDVCILLALSKILGFPVFYSNLISSLCAAFFVFTISRKRIHYGQEGKLLGRILLYLAYTFVLIILASSIMPALTMAIQDLGNGAFTISLSVFIAKITITPPQLLANFFVSKLVAMHNFQTKKSGQIVK